jgi:hypothetical protein
VVKKYDILFIADEVFSILFDEIEKMSRKENAFCADIDD